MVLNGVRTVVYESFLSKINVIAVRVQIRGLFRSVLYVQEPHWDAEENRTYGGIKY